MTALPNLFATTAHDHTDRERCRTDVFAPDDHAGDHPAPGAPDPVSLKRSLADLDTKRKECDDATVAVRRARAVARSASSAAEAAEAAVRTAWRDFDVTRDALAPFGPPPADRDDLAGAWTALAAALVLAGLALNLAGARRKLAAA